MADICCVFKSLNNSVLLLHVVSACFDNATILYLILYTALLSIRVAVVPRANTRLVRIVTYVILADAPSAEAKFFDREVGPPIFRKERERAFSFLQCLFEREASLRGPPRREHLSCSTPRTESIKLRLGLNISPNIAPNDERNGRSTRIVHGILLLDLNVYESKLDEIRRLTGVNSCFQDCKSVRCSVRRKIGEMFRSVRGVTIFSYAYGKPLSRCMRSFAENASPRTRRFVASLDEHEYTWSVRKVSELVRMEVSFLIDIPFEILSVISHKFLPTTLRYSYGNTP